jgi:hypothetical protein
MPRATHAACATLALLLTPATAAPAQAPGAVEGDFV